MCADPPHRPAEPDVPARRAGGRAPSIRPRRRLAIAGALGCAILLAGVPAMTAGALEGAESSTRQRAGGGEHHGAEASPQQGAGSAEQQGAEAALPPGEPRTPCLASLAATPRRERRTSRRASPAAAGRGKRR